MTITTTYGKDVSCTSTMRTGRLVTGARLVAEAAYRRLITPPGTLRGGEEEENYGIDLPGLVGGSNPASLAATLPGRIRTELLKDERIVSVDAAVELVAEDEIEVTIECDLSSGETFELVLSVDAVSAEIVGLT